MAKPKKSDKITFSISKSALFPLLFLIITATPIVIVASGRNTLREQELNRVYQKPTPNPISNTNNNTCYRPNGSSFLTTGECSDFVWDKNSNLVTSKSTTKKTTPQPTNSVVRNVQPTINSDPPVHCPIADDCGGGTRPLKQSECENTTCCRTKSGWEFMLKTKCESIHSSYDKEMEKITSRTALFVGNVTRYCDESAHSAIKDSYSAYEKAVSSDMEWGSFYCKDKSSASDMTAYKECYESSFSSSNYLKKVYDSLIANHCN